MAPVCQLLGPEDQTQLPRPKLMLVVVPLRNHLPLIFEATMPPSLTGTQIVRVRPEKVSLPAPKALRSMVAWVGETLVSLTVMSL
jgi:hypothetical protein